ncbi:MAG: glycerophosphodiester phosphodiesterase [Mycobacteriales bacterium]
MVGVSAHRGGHEVAPEGTLPAYRAAILAGVDLIEVDVRRRADGTLVCAHDPLDGAAVSRLRTLSPPDSGRNLDIAAPAPLAAVLDLAAEHGVGGHIDVKESGYEAELVAFVGRRLALAYYTSGDGASVERLCAAGGLGLLTVGSGLAGKPWWQVVRLVLGDYFPYRRILRCGAGGVAVQFRFCTPWLRAWLRRRQLLCLVYTVDGTRSLRRLLRRRGVTAVVTNRPMAALAIRDRRSTAVPHVGGDFS